MNFSFGNVHLGYYVKEPLVRNFSLATVFRNLCLETFVWELLFGSFCLGTVVYDPSSMNFCFGTFSPTRLACRGSYFLSRNCLVWVGRPVPPAWPRWFPRPWGTSSPLWKMPMQKCLGVRNCVLQNCPGVPNTLFEKCLGLLKCLRVATPSRNQHAQNGRDTGQGLPYRANRAHFEHVDFLHVATPSIWPDSAAGLRLYFT